MEIDTIEKTNNLMNIGMIDTSFDSTKKFIDDMQIITLKYLAAIKEVENRIDIINEDFKVHKGTSPIEHVSSRVKSPLSILNKLSRMNVQFFDIKTMEENIFDIAGIRISCSFIEDIYNVANILGAFDDFEIIKIKDYVKNPKPSGYRSYHMIVKVPVHLTTGAEMVNVEIQIRTMAMDFWASLEHKIKYKYDGTVPTNIVEELHKCSIMAANMDEKMQKLKKEILDIND